MYVKNVSVSYSETVFEQPFQAKVLGVVLEAELDKEEEIIACEATLMKHAVSLVKSFVKKYAPGAKSFDNLERIKNGKPIIGSVSDVIDIGV